MFYKNNLSEGNLVGLHFPKYIIVFLRNITCIAIFIYFIRGVFKYNNIYQNNLITYVIL